MSNEKQPSYMQQKEQIKSEVIGKLMRHYGRTLEDATEKQCYSAVALTVRDAIMDTWIRSKRARHRQGTKRLYYLSVEFLVGRSLASNLINLLKTDVYRDALSELGMNLEVVEAQEPDAGLGNGGLGRLAACFMDSLASLSLPAMGCSIRYEYGLFRQKIENGSQVEVPDNWLEAGSPWEIAVPDDQVEVRFGGTINERWENGRLNIDHHGYNTVIALPYDMPIVGYDCSSAASLRLWSAKAPTRIDMQAFNQGDYVRAMQEKELAEVISKVLYPEDNHAQGRELRLKQQYFFCSATVQYIIKDFKRRYPELPLTKLYEKAAIHINDTHPTLAIPELMRLLLDEEGLSWDQAWDVCKKTFAYTNHTIMAEALERWSEPMLRQLLPRVHAIIVAINQRYTQSLASIFPNQWDRIASMAIVSGGEVRMANLCIALSHMVNGVSQLHAQILKHEVFSNFYIANPDQFTGITNGITHRRWLLSANPGLTGLLRETIGDGFIRDPQQLLALKPYAEDAAFREAFAKIKRENKLHLSNYVHDTLGRSVDPDSLFDVQAKRLHEYKRQLLNCLHILHLYNRLMAEPDFDPQPRTFFFAAKAAPGYARAKLIIRLIHSISELVERTPRTSEKIRVVFLPNYSVSVAEVLIPATELSEQISVAGKEASGTGNMKFMMNGALTIGTMDGANVEMSEHAGLENLFIFGYTAAETSNMYQQNNYHAGQYYENDPRIRAALDRLIDGTLPADFDRQFQPIHHSLLFGDYGMADQYLLLGDFGAYTAAHEQVEQLYRQQQQWQRKAVINTATSGWFSSDRTIEEYNQKAWYLPKLVL